jgi:N-methylhydantoinase B
VSERIDDNLTIEEHAGARWVACAHCGERVSADPDDYLPDLAYRTGSPRLAGPGVRADAAIYLDRQVEFRQYCCPHCFTAVRTQVVPVDHAEVTRAGRLAQPSGSAE